MFYKRRPLPATFMLASMLGLIVTIVYTGSGRFDEWFNGNGNTWGFTFGLIFAIMFFASLVSLESNKVPKSRRSFATETLKAKRAKRKPAKKKSSSKKKAVKRKVSKAPAKKKKPVKKSAAKKKVAKKKSSKKRR